MSRTKDHIMNCTDPHCSFCRRPPGYYLLTHAIQNAESTDILDQVDIILNALSHPDPHASFLADLSLLKRCRLIAAHYPSNE